MKWINYNHLYYFWIVARECSIARAADELMVSQPTISIQIKELETRFRKRLFDRVGRGLKLTEAGRIALNYANEIFSLGQEMNNALENQPAGWSLKLSVGSLDDRHFFASSNRRSRSRRSAGANQAALRPYPEPWRHDEIRSAD